MWQGSQYIRATQRESPVQNKQMTAIWYVSDTEMIIKASWSPFQHNGAAEFTWSERLPLPPALSSTDLSAWPIQLSNVSQITRLDHHPVQSDEDSKWEIISDTENWLHCNGDLNDPIDSNNDCQADVESNKELDNGIAYHKSPEQGVMSATSNVPGLIWPVWKSKRQAEQWFVMVNALEIRSNTKSKKSGPDCFHMFSQHLYVALSRVSSRHILCEKCEQSHVNIGW